MSDLYQTTSKPASMGGESDRPPAEYHQLHGEQEANVEHIGHDYPAVVTAHFFDRASADQVLEALARFTFSRPQAIQVFEDIPASSRDAADDQLAPGEIGLLVQLDSEEQGREILRLCETAGAKHARIYPPQHIGHV